LLAGTIAAIATPLGESGIGIVRISGDRAIEIAKKIFVPYKNREWWRESGYKLVYGHIIEPLTEDIIDEALLGFMRSPNSFTREDIIEFNCHGGVVPLRQTLEVVLRQGARLAEPGEFSCRAFLNGRVDLAQAEAIIDVIRAKTDKQLKIAQAQLKGKLSEKIYYLQDKLTSLLAICEAVIDFPEDVEATPYKELETLLVELLVKIEELVRAADKGKVYSEGALVVITGRTNVGKSSLLNRLLRQSRAIVTDIPGTTRDVIEDVLNIKGVPVRIADTAGLRPTSDPIEKIGVEKTKELLEVADLVLVMVDAQTGITGADQEIFSQIKERKTIYLLNKIDLSKDEKIFIQLRDISQRSPVLKISALTGEGLEELEKEIFCALTGGETFNTDTLLAINLRHKNALLKAWNCLGEALEGVRAGLPEDLLAIDIKNAWEALGEITGSAVTEDMIKRIFANFCIGK